MELGNKIMKLRKEMKLSQDSLAEKLGVTRQTVSNWEVNSTKPDIIQIKRMSKLFNISIDELLDNDVRDIMEKKISNTERLSNKNSKNIKILVITLYFIILVGLISFILYFTMNKDFTNKYQTDFSCYKDNLVYDFELDLNDKQYTIIVNECNNKSNEGCTSEEHPAGNDLNTAIESLNTAKKIIINNGGFCK